MKKNHDIKQRFCVCSSLLFTKVKLEEALFGPATALQTCEEMLQRWQSRYDVSRSRLVCLCEMCIQANLLIMSCRMCDNFKTMQQIQGIFLFQILPILSHHIQHLFSDGMCRYFACPGFLFVPKYAFYKPIYSSGHCQSLSTLYGC